MRGLHSQFTQVAVDIDGNEVQLSKYAGKVVVVVNVASACGYTDSNYRGKGACAIMCDTAQLLIATQSLREAAIL